MKVRAFLKNPVFKGGRGAVPAAIAALLALMLAFSACTANIADSASPGASGASAGYTALATQQPKEDADGIFTIAVIPDTAGGGCY